MYKNILVTGTGKMKTRFVNDSFKNCLFLDFGGVEPILNLRYVEVKTINGLKEIIRELCKKLTSDNTIVFDLLSQCYTMVLEGCGKEEEAVNIIKQSIIDLNKAGYTVIMIDGMHKDKPIFHSFESLRNTIYSNDIGISETHRLNLEEEYGEIDIIKLNWFVSLHNQMKAETRAIEEFKKENNNDNTTRSN